MIRKTFALLLVGVVAACSQPATTGRAPAGGTVGAASPRAAVESFLGAVKAQDLQAMAVIWGTSKGPARDQVPRDQLEKRELIMQCYLLHDSARIVRESPAEGSGRAYLVELTKGPLVRSTNFYTIEGPGGRWFVENVDLEPVADLCRGGPPGGA